MMFVRQTSQGRHPGWREQHVQSYEVQKKHGILCRGGEQKTAKGIVGLECHPGVVSLFLVKDATDVYKASSVMLCGGR